MKKIFLTLAISACIGTAIPSYGQGFLNKVAKTLDKVNKDLDKLGGKDTKATGTTNKQPETKNKSLDPLYSNVLVRSFSPNVSLVLESCIREGKKVTITYFLTNAGADFSISKLGMKKYILNKTEETIIVDSNGDGHELKHYSIGKANEFSNRMPMPSEVRMKGVLEIYGVAMSAKQLSLVNIAGLYERNNDSDEFVHFSFSFKNVPIVTVDETMEKLNPTTLLTIEKPVIEKKAEINSGIEAIQITDKYTKVTISYKNLKYNPTAYLFLADPDRIILTANGKNYSLKQFSGITTRQEDVVVPYQETGRYVYYFEPIPADVTSIDITGDDFEFKGVKTKSAAK